MAEVKSVCTRGMLLCTLLQSTACCGNRPPHTHLGCRQERRVSRAAAFWLDEVLQPSDTLAAAGVAYHLADLLLPELSKCVAEGGPRAAAPDDAALRRLLEPFASALAATSNPAMVHRFKCAAVGQAGAGQGWGCAAGRGGRFCLLA